MITIRPNPFDSASGPIYYRFETDRHTAHPGVAAQVDVRLNAVPTSGTRLVVAGVKFRFLTLADGLDVFHPGHISLETAPTLAQMAARTRDALAAHPALMGVLGNYAVVPIGAHYVVQGYGLAPAPLATPNQAYSPGGAAYTNPATDPVFVDLTTAGALPTFRAGYALNVYPFIEAQYRQDPDIRALPALRIPAPDVPGTAVYTFRLEDVLRPALGFDLPSPTETAPTPAHLALRRAYIEYAETHGSTPAETGKRWRDVPPSDSLPYSFLVLNTTLPEWDGLLRPELDADGCPTATLSAPHRLAPYFTGTAPLVPLATANRKDTYAHAPEYFCFYAPEGDARFATSENLRLVAQVGADYIYAPETLAEHRLCHPGQTFQGQAWVVPLARLWDALGPTPPDEFRVFLGQPPVADNLFTAYNNGTFEGVGGLSDFNLLQGLGYTVPSLDPTQSYAGIQCMRVLVQKQATSQPQVRISHTTSLTLLPNTVYEATAWVNVLHGGLRTGQPVGIGTTGFSDITVLSAQSWVQGTHGYGHWRRIRQLFRTGVSVLGRLELHIGNELDFLDSDVQVLFDVLRLQLHTPEAVTEGITYVVRPGCRGGATVAFQNPLGMPETLHALPNPEERPTRTTQTAAAVPTREDPLAPRPRGVLEYGTETAPTFRLQTPPLAPWAIPQARALLASPAVYLLNETATEWLPVTLSGPEGPLTGPDATRRPLRFSVEAR